MNKLAYKELWAGGHMLSQVNCTLFWPHISPSRMVCECSPVLALQGFGDLLWGLLSCL